MFTGIVEEVGIISGVAKSEKSASLTIRASKVLEHTKLGDSISTNGVCLTVTSFVQGGFTADVMAETMRKTNLHLLRSGAEVNLERALRAGDRLGGHMVSGHIDGIGTISKYENEDNAVWITIEAPAEILKYVIYKGSIAIDGVSLTVAYVDDFIFKVSVIPHTKDMTALLKKKTGDVVNLECDMVGKYIEKLLKPEYRSSQKKEMNLQFLTEHGFA